MYPWQVVPSDAHIDVSEYLGSKNTVAEGSTAPSSSSSSSSTSIPEFLLSAGQKWEGFCSQANLGWFPFEVSVMSSTRYDEHSFSGEFFWPTLRFGRTAWRGEWKSENQWRLFETEVVAGSYLGVGNSYNFTIVPRGNGGHMMVGEWAGPTTRGEFIAPLTNWSDDFHAVLRQASEIAAKISLTTAPGGDSWGSCVSVACLSKDSIEREDLMMVLADAACNPHIRPMLVEAGLEYFFICHRTTTSLLTRVAVEKLLAYVMSSHT